MMRCWKTTYTVQDDQLFLQVHAYTQHAIPRKSSRWRQPGSCMIVLRIAYTIWLQISEVNNETCFESLWNFCNICWILCELHFQMIIQCVSGIAAWATKNTCHASSCMTSSRTRASCTMSCTAVYLQSEVGNDTQEGRAGQLEMTSDRCVSLAAWPT